MSPFFYRRIYDYYYNNTINFSYNSSIYKYFNKETRCKRRIAKDRGIIA